jgi:hypothetical protein
MMVMVMTEVEVVVLLKQSKQMARVTRWFIFIAMN